MMANKTLKVFGGPERNKGQPPKRKTPGRAAKNDTNKPALTPGQRKRRSAIKRALLEELKTQGNDSPLFVDLVNDYLACWTIQQYLKADIDERGVSIEWNNGGGQSGYKKNDSISELSRINSQMLKILKELNIKTTHTDSAKDKEDDEDSKYI